MKFGDVIIAVASLAVIFIFFDFVFGIALVPINSTWGPDFAAILSFLVSGLVVGYVFAGKIREESRMASIGKLVVLNAALMLVGFLLFLGAAYHYGPMIDESLQSMYHTNSWTNTDWYAYETVMEGFIAVLFVVYALVFGFIGLYLGSMRKPSAKTKE